MPINWILGHKPQQSTKSQQRNITKSKNPTHYKKLRNKTHYKKLRNKTHYKKLKTKTHYK